MSEGPSVYHCDKVKARKQHMCLECGGAINVGEIYNHHHGVWDGTGASFKVCVECDELRSKIDADVKDPEEQVSFGQLMEFVFEREKLDEMKTFIMTREKRNSIIPLWMNNLFDRAMNADDEKATIEEQE